MSTATATDRVLKEGFDTSRVIGKTLAELDQMPELDWAGAYPVLEDGTVTGIVDANYPDTFNGGNWKIVDDSYAIATEDDDETDAE